MVECKGCFNLAFDSKSLINQLRFKKRLRTSIEISGTRWGRARNPDNFGTGVARRIRFARERG